MYASACRQALNDALAGLILIHHSLLPLFVPKRFVGFSGYFWFEIFQSNSSWKWDLKLITEEGDLVK